MSMLEHLLLMDATIQFHFASAFEIQIMKHEHQMETDGEQFHRDGFSYGSSKTLNLCSAFGAVSASAVVMLTQGFSSSSFSTKRCLCVCMCIAI